MTFSLGELRQVLVILIACGTHRPAQTWLSPNTVSTMLELGGEQVPVQETLPTPCKQNRTPPTFFIPRGAWVLL